MSVIIMKPIKNKTAFVTFSSRELKEKKGVYMRFVDAIESECNLKIKYRWFDQSHIYNEEQIYLKSLKAIREADIFIAESSIGSTGVGQEITYAIQQKKPVILCVRKEIKNNNETTFVKGTKSSLVHFVYYDKLEDLVVKIRKKVLILGEIRLEKFNFLAGKNAKEILAQESRIRNISQSELLREILDEWIVTN